MRDDYELHLKNYERRWGVLYGKEMAKIKVWSWYERTLWKVWSRFRL